MKYGMLIVKRICFIIIFGTVGIGFSQERIVYTFFINLVSEEFKVPLIGFVNIADGSHSSPQIGFVNRNTGSFSSLQIGFVNTSGGDTKGSQIGFVNTSANDTKGSQIGFVNTSANDTRGSQIGFVNTAGADMKGSQIGFVNISANDTRGLQIGFVNKTPQNLKGVQIGFVNYVDSVESGFPIGFISIVKHGGYKAVEYSISEYYPFTVELKTGVERFYTNIIVAYNPFSEFTSKQVAMGVGIGSILPIYKRLFFNPELNELYSLFSNKYNKLLSITPFLGFFLNKNFSITAGPSITWQEADNSELQRPVFRITENIIDKNNSIVIAARAGVRFRF